MENSGIYVGLDIGTASIKVVIAEYLKNQLNIIGYGSSHSKGLSRGVIVDIDQAVDTIKEAIKQAEQKANIEIDSVTVGVPANMLQIQRCKGMIAVSQDGNSAEITDEDVHEVTRAALVQNLPPERDVIDVVPDEFYVDDIDNIKDPRGMMGVRLEMQGVMYTGPKTILHNIRKCVEKAGLKIHDIVVAPIALSKYALSDAEQDFGAVLIDLGAGQTTAAVVHDSKVKYTYVDQEGGNYVTRDISIVLNTSLENAENLKRNYGYALASLASTDDSVPVQVVGQQEDEMVTEEYLSEIIEARMRQIFEKIKQSLETINAFQLPGGIVLTGGMAAMQGITELAQEIFGVPVKIFYPQEMNLRSPQFSQVLGLIEDTTHQSEINMVVKSTLDNIDFIAQKVQQPVQKQPMKNVSKNQKTPTQSTNKKAKQPKKQKKQKENKIKNFFSSFFD
ncbi:cell division protein FtsA [Ligilactobacillus cholophilus]|uniref:cell division protein FtsA n=1 Tax=Ligilactobacillus cholophilus TaxID=3050131 RepID=UPI0025B22663|nr:cell division protein FtsA [Ligilactobacillus cholophilus]